LRKDGTYFIWGNNGASGMFGDGLTTLTTRSGPDFASTVLGSYDWIAGSMRETMGSCFGIRRNGELFSWGRNPNGVLGIGVTTLRSSPVSVGTAGGIGYSSVFAMSGSAAAIDNNKGLWTWGGNGSGQLGDGSVVSRSTPAKVGSESWVMFSGHDYSMAIHANGALYTWGSGGGGVLGNNATVARSSPVQLGSESWQFVYAGGTAAYAIHANGALYAWGENRDGCLGDGTTINKSSPVKIGSESWITVQSGTPNSTHTAGVLAIHANGALYAWGNNAIGQLGDGTTINKSSPVKIGASSWTTIGGGTQVRAAAIGSDLYTWGLGPVRGNVASVINVSSPVVVGPASYRISPIKIGSQSWTRVAAGFSYAIGLLANGQIYGWGVNGSGQLGNGTTAGTSSPVFSSITSGINWAQITASEQTGYARASNGAIYSWGGGALGQLGDGTTVTKSSLVKIGAESWSSITAGGSHIVGLLANNKLAAWGLNSSGQLGDGTTLNKSSPVVIGSESWSFATAGVNTAQAVHANGALFSWGNNVFGQLGIGLTTNRSSPTQVGTSPTFWKSALSDTGPFGLSIMISKSGTIVSAGYNNNGAMGDGTTL
jgi:alpha-tubulin suppressor-like RCC1 family protein